MSQPPWCFLLFFFNDTATTEIYTLSLHDALPISIAPTMSSVVGANPRKHSEKVFHQPHDTHHDRDRKSTRLNSSHQIISYAAFCLKKKKHSRPTKAKNTTIREGNIHLHAERRLAN